MDDQYAHYNLEHLQYKLNLRKKSFGKKNGRLNQYQNKV